MIIVQKYGGSSVSTTEKIMNIAKKLVEIKNEGNKLVVVVSAMGKTTDSLIKMSKEISSNPPLREMDRLLSTGEQQTIALLSIAINELGCKSISLTGEQAGIKTIGIHTKSKIDSIDSEKIMKYLMDDNIVIVAGFQGYNENNDITTLGRGGSDTTAVALAASLNGKCEIYTDVDGIYSIDPRIYKYAKKLKYISYEEMMEMSFTGSGVMETRSVELGNKYNVEIYVGRSLGEKNGTIITNKEKILEKKKITGISVNTNLLHVTIDNIPTYAKNLYPIFELADKLGITIDMISQNDVVLENGSFAFTTSKNDKNQVLKLIETISIENENINCILNEKMAKITLVGIGLISNVSIISKIFKILSDNNISFHQVATSEISISLVVNEDEVQKLAMLFAESFDI